MAVSQKPFSGRKEVLLSVEENRLFRPKALVPLFRMLKEAGIPYLHRHKMAESGNEDVKELLSLADLVPPDVKEFNDERHKALTSRSNAHKPTKLQPGLKKIRNRSGCVGTENTVILKKT